MPTPREGESRSDFVARCVPVAMGEGLDQDAAVGKCEGMYSSWLKEKGGKSKSNDEDNSSPPFGMALT